jgi:hypothetical protein
MANCSRCGGVFKEEYMRRSSDGSLVCRLCEAKQGGASSKKLTRADIRKAAAVGFVLLAVTGSFLGRHIARQRRIAAERREAMENMERERAAEEARQWGRRLEKRLKQDVLLSGAADHLRSEEAQLRKHTAIMLGEMGADAQPMIGELTKLAVDDPDPDVRAAAAEALKKIRGEEPSK